MAAEKKKTVTALCLIAVMIIMWARVISRKTPAAVAAAVLTQEDVKPAASDLELNLSFIELPKIEGRNDVLTRDFFAVGDWQDFIRNKEGKNLNEDVNVVSRHNKEVMKRVAEKLKLEAIGLDGNPQVFINNKLLSVGDKLLVKDGGNTYECEVVSIEENTVLIKCGEAEITLKLAKVIEVGD
ncbi:MAG: sortase family protein [Planctomycetota bacterium]